MKVQSTENEVRFEQKLGEEPSAGFHHASSFTVLLAGKEVSSFRKWLWSERAEALKATLPASLEEPIVLEVVEEPSEWEVVSDSPRYGTTIRLKVEGGFLYKTLPFNPQKQFDGLMSITPTTFVPSNGGKNA